MKKFLILFILILSLMNFSNAEKEESKSGFVPFPVVFYTPETGFGGGAALIYYYNPHPENPDSKNNNISAVAFYTAKNQFLLALNSDVFFNTDKYMFSANTGFSKFPSKFYGIGSNTEEDDEEDFTYLELGIETSFKFKLKKEMYIGPALYFLHLKEEETADSMQLASGLIPGSEGGSYPGVGFQYSWDTRDLYYYPSKGHFFEVKTAFYGGILGGDSDFSKITVDFRKYFSIHKNHIIAVQFLSEFLDGGVPFREMPAVGGDKILRGYYGGRYIDKNLIVLQAEYRFPIYNRFRGALFAGAGEVFPEYDNFNGKNIKYSGGLGFRYALDKEQKINIRIDFGFGENDSGFYFQVMEAF